MNEAGKERAAQLLRSTALERGLSSPQVADLAGVDRGTVSDFWEGKRWPRVSTRTALEAVLNLKAGALEEAARNLTPESAPVDPVEFAIENSGLSRANRAKLLGYYFDMVDTQERGSTG